MIGKSDAGHGGKDPGASANGVLEKDLALKIDEEFTKGLRNNGITMLRSRTNDTFVNLSNRNVGNVNFFVSHHINSFGNPQANGVEVLYNSTVKGSKELAESVLKWLVRTGLFKSNRGTKVRNDLAVLKNKNHSSCLIEYGFISNPEERKMIQDNYKTLAIAAANGVLEYLGVEYVEDNKIEKNNKTTGKLYRVQVGAYSVKSNAEKMLNDLKLAGFNGFIKAEDVETRKNEEKPVLEEFIYYEKHDLKIIETNPENIYVATLPGKNLRQFGIYGMSGTWQNNPEAHLPRSIWGLAINNNKPIGPNSHINSPNGHKRGTLICYDDNTMVVRQINHIDEIGKPVKWAIGGGSLIPYYNPAEEKIASDILRNTHHGGIGFKGNRVYQIVTSSHCTMAQFRQRVLKLNLDGAIFLDGGGSTQMNWKDNQGLYSSRPLSHGIFIKGVK